MYEVEIKVPATLESVRYRLIALDATPTGEVRQADTYYDAPHRSFPETDEALRIRRESTRTETAEKTVITYKGPLVDDDSKTRTEVETAVEDADDFAAILTNLGFEPAAIVRKERERFELESYTITLDRVEGVGEFVEVETEVDTEAAIESARKGAFDTLEKLGLDPADQIRTSYLGLLLEE